MDIENKPNSIQLELVHGCDRRCSYCGTMGFKHEFIYVSEECLKKSLSLIKNSNWNPRIILGGAGEPTLHPELLNRLKLIRNELPKFHIQLINNGFWIRKYGYSFIKELLKYVNDVSLDDYDSNINIEELQKYISEFENENSCKVELTGLKNGVSFYDVKNYKKKRVLVIPPITMTQDMMSRKFSNHCGAGMPKSNRYNHKKCTMIFRDMMIRCDGNIPICCDDFRGEYSVCNIMSDSFNSIEQVWNHPRFTSARKILFHKGRKYIYPCNICTTKTLREGFLPEVEEPTKEDFKIVSEKHEPLYEIVERDYEKNPVNKPLFEM